MVCCIAAVASRRSSTQCVVHVPLYVVIQLLAMLSLVEPFISKYRSTQRCGTFPPFAASGRRLVGFLFELLFLDAAGVCSLLNCNPQLRGVFAPVEFLILK